MDGEPLHQNHPNPFNPTTEITFSLNREGPVVLTIHDAAGKRVRTLVNHRMSPGHHSETWDGRDSMGNTVATGVYFYWLRAGSQVLTRKAVLLK